MDNPVLLSLKGIEKKFGDLSILRDVNLDLHEKESIAILGPSGVGKSTLLHIAGLMESASAGEIILDGVNVSTMTEPEKSKRRLHSIGFLFQFHFLMPDFSALENVLMPARLAGDDLQEKEKEAQDILTRFKLGERMTHRPHQLSGGEQQRAALARALIRKPKLLLCDEPTGNLDHQTALETMEYLWEEGRSRNLALVIVTHNTELAKRADKIYHLLDGKLEEIKRSSL